MDDVKILTMVICKPTMYVGLYFSQVYSLSFFSHFALGSLNWVLGLGLSVNGAWVLLGFFCVGALYINWI